MKDSKRLLGYSALAIGAGAILIGASPLFPVYGEAFLIGGALIAVGAWVLAGPELRRLLRRALRTVVQSRKSRSWRAPRHSIDPLLPVRILKLAKEHRGVLTVSEVAMALNISLDHAETGLEECVRAGNALPDYDIARSRKLYRFPEFQLVGDDSLLV